MPEEVKVLKADGQTRHYTDIEQTEIDRRIEAQEPLFDEEREGYVAPKEGEEKVVEEKTDEEGEKPEKKEQEDNKEDKKDEEKSFEEYDETDKLDLIAQKEIELENEEDEEKKKEIQVKLDDWNKKLDDPIQKKEELEDLESEIQSYAKEKSISESEAKKIVEGEIAISKRFEDSPKKLARAYRSLQVDNVKSKHELERLQKEVSEHRIESLVPKDIRPEAVFNKSREEVIDIYRQSHEEAEDMEDEKVYQLCQKAIYGKIKENKKMELESMTKDAQIKRAELLTTMSKDSEPFKDIVKEQLSKCSDSQVLSENFNLKDIERWCRGDDKYVSNLVREAKKEGYKRGLEQRRILKESGPSGGSSKTKHDKIGGTGKNYGLTESEIAEAKDFYRDNDIPDSRKLELFADSKRKIEERKKSNS